MRHQQEFTRKAIQKAALYDMVLHPFTLYPSGIGLLSCVAYLLFGPEMGTVWGAAIGFGIGAASLLINGVFRRKTIEDRNVRKLYELLEKEREATASKVIDDLHNLSLPREYYHYVEQAKAQYESVNKRLDTVRSLLDSKLNQGELTHARYLGAAEKVHISVLSNLGSISSLLRSLSSVDLNYIDVRQRKLKELKNPARADEQEFETLEERKSLAESQSERVNEMLTQNERAITELDRVGAAIAGLRIQDGRVVDFDDAIEELEEMANRVKLYA